MGANMIKTLKTLNGVTEGKYKVTTKSGSIYIIDFNGLTLTRNPPEGVNALVYDGISIPFESVTCVEAYSMVFESGRHSTPVVDIEEVKEMTHDELLARIFEIENEGSDPGEPVNKQYKAMVQLEKALRAVVEFHMPMKNSEIDEFGNDDIGCGGCGYDFNYSRWNNVYPCSTIQAIEKELNK